MFGFQQQQQVRHICERIRRDLAAHGTNVEQNDKDRWGDGDQSKIRKASHQQFYRELFSQGGDIGESLFSGLVSEFAVACVTGAVARVQQMLEQAAAASEQQTSGGGVNDLENSALVRLLERRETSHDFQLSRFSVSLGQATELERDCVDLRDQLGQRVPSRRLGRALGPGSP